jgi:predicted NBD/HSP70 family sugar kinase
VQKATHQHTKDHNTHLILRTIYHTGDISRAEIARRTRLTRPTVSRIVGQLMDDRFVVETGRGPSAGGKRPTLLDVAYDDHQLLALDLGGQEFRGAVVNLRGEIIARQDDITNGHQGEAALGLVDALIAALTQAATAPLLGIGVGSPGLTNPRDGIIREAVNLGWWGLPLRKILEDRYELPAYVANDSHIAALGEYTFGAGPGAVPAAGAVAPAGNLVVIKIDQGIGAGIVLNGQPFYGDGFGAGEIGHVVVDEGGALCSCGNVGCLEATVSTRAILREAQLAASSETLTWTGLVQALEAGEEWALGVVQRAGCFLGVAIANLVATLNVKRIVLSGRVSQFGQLLLDAALVEAGRRALPSMVSETELSFSALGDDVVILGSSAMILKHELGII